ncbi:L,D-transpeptidase family protein [Neobacillus drentensis]|uniref:L,D-transpeptidase family protein n=1 Tax=Neobacillus drentensis TaxID=220684 RepID=UPI003B588BCC
MSTANETVEEIDKGRVNRFKRPAKRKFIVIGIIIIIALLIAGISYYQVTRFNSQVTINGTKVGGLTADQVINKLKTSELKNRVYVGNQLILDEKDTQMVFTDKDLPEVKKLLKSQWTFFPSSKEKNYSLIPKKADQFRSQTMKKQVEEKLLSMNKNLKAPQDAEAKLEQGQIVISNSINGEQYDIDGLLKDYKKQKYTSDIHLKPVFIQPIKEDSLIVKEEEKMLQDLLQQTVDYKVQDKVYPLKASELIKNASVSKDKKVTITMSDIKNKIDEINSSQSTLNKNFTFKTHSGSVIQVKGQGYGWAINAEKETAKIQEAFEKGEKSLSASNIHGNGWSNEGIGYETTTNNGIGDTYAEVSIAEQRIWIYKNGQLVVTTNVVTGKHSTGEDTSPGVWYILYKRPQYTLKGSAVGKPDYAIKVNYWAPFTNSGQGFHDASWRTNWASNAYLTGGSGGCVNTPPNIMKTVYDTLSIYDPVVIY